MEWVSIRRFRLKAGLRTDFPRRAWNDGAEKLRPGYCSMASIGSLYHPNACRRESPVRLDAIHYRPDQESACKPGSGPVDPLYLHICSDGIVSDQCLPG